MAPDLIRIKIYKLSFLRNLMDARDRPLYYFIKGGEAIKVTSQRYALFKKSTKCVCCGLEASFLAAERAKDSKYKRSHINMYGIKDGKEVLFTKDHIVPVSKGGKDHLNNYQTMCEECNTRKGTKTIKF